MSLNDAPSANRVHIGFFGLRNAGKSSMVNAVTGQDLAIVSEVAGTTTDPVYKAMELLPLGPVVIVDTPGIDDSGGLGELRVQRALRALSKIDEAVLVIDAVKGRGASDEKLIALFAEKKLPYILAYNKCDLLDRGAALPLGKNEIYVSAKTGTGIHELKELIAANAGEALEDTGLKLAGALVQPGDFVVLVIPIDKAAPKGRLILPEQQVIRDLLDRGAASIVTTDTGLRSVLEKLKDPPALVVTDSQAFRQVAQIVPEDVPLTSFSILFARYKGFLETALDGITALENLRNGDKVLVCEGCTHHRQCDDIGTVKLPRWLGEYTGAALDFTFSSGGGFPEDLSPYKLILHCGGCMLNKRELKFRFESARDANVPITNYGLAIAQMNGILKRSIAMLHKNMVFF
jgi:[FeFe] hydrogenase H-cluster maturation GTPase HydF